ncbi:PREDICTED: venom peptide isomerase heavy chain-like [Wasmannia auropunctata]|uniref:venom peptide isomerase heavy chain-like n=1 Tax=Wasmannia auropunctata TaxID=64793 RepID=UPI0005EDAE48|nr:PREDICTED: venom peptide isomerase heavy chain-like [Wasmannia auropunctata]
MNSTRIAGGNYARFGQFPFMAVVNHLVGNRLFRQCSGTIIHTRWVLTAGHCVQDPLKIDRMFFIAVDIINKPSVEYEAFIRNPGVKMITNQSFVHPEYRDGQSHNDIALLQVDESFANKNGLVMGWRESKKLKYAEVSVIQNTECKRVELSGSDSTSDVTDNYVYIATGLGEGTCQNGAPLTVKSRNDEYLQIGILGMSTCSSNVPEMLLGFLRI